MKRKTAMFLSLLMAFILIFSFGSTFAQYKNDVTVEKSIDYARTAGSISIHDTAGVEGYVAATESFAYAPGNPRHVHYKISNTSVINGQPYTDQRNTEYYIRVMAESDDDKKVFADKTDYNNSWGVCPLWTWTSIATSNPYPKNDAVGGYGPFKWNETKNLFESSDGRELVSGSYLDVVVEHGSEADVESLKGVITLKVQLFTKRGNTVQVIDQTDFRVQITNETGTADLVFTYWSYGTPNEPITGENGASTTQTFKKVPFGTHYDFTNPDNLAARGIALPEGYSFVTADSIVSYANSAAWGWTAKTSFDVDDKMNEGTPIQVILIRDDSILVQFQYWDRSDQKNDGTFNMISGQDGAQMSQYVQLKKGGKLDFEAGTFTLPQTAGGTVQTLADAGIKVPSKIYKTENGSTVEHDSKYIAAHCNVERWWESDQHYYQDIFNVPDKPMVSTAVIDVYMAPVAMRETVRVYLYKAVGGTAQFVEEKTAQVDANGMVTITPEQTRAWLSGYRSYEVGIVNDNPAVSGYRSTCPIGYTVNAGAIVGNVTIDCFHIYYDERTEGNSKLQAGYCMSNTQMRVYVIGWP